MTDWLILLCFLVIAYFDWKKHIIPNIFLVLIAVLSLIGRTTIDFYGHIGIGVVALVVGVLIYKVSQWSKGDIWLTGVVGLAFGTQTPWVILIAALTMLIYQSIWKSKAGLPWGVPVGVGSVILTIFS